MGLIRAAKDAVSSMMADQWRESIFTVILFPTMYW